MKRWKGVRIACLTAGATLAAASGGSGQSEALGFSATISGGLSGEWRGCAEVSSNGEVMHFFLTEDESENRTIEFGLSLRRGIAGAIQLTKLPSMGVTVPAEWVKDGRGYGIVFDRPNLYDFVEGTVTVHMLNGDRIAAEFRGRIEAQYAKQPAVAEVKGEFVALQDSVFSDWVYRPSARFSEPRPPRPAYCRRARESGAGGWGAVAGRVAR